MLRYYRVWISLRNVEEAKVEVRGNGDMSAMAEDLPKEQEDD
jgi:hypothetical protein